MVCVGDQTMSLADAAGANGLVAEDTIEYGDLSKKMQQSIFGAPFLKWAWTRPPEKSACGAC